MTDYAALLPYAKTDRQREILSALSRLVPRSGVKNGGGTAEIARVLHVTRSTVRDVVRTVKTNAARAGYAPENRPAWAQEVPEGHRVRGVSTLVDESGNTLKQWGKTERAPDPPTRPIVPEGHHVKKTATMLDRQGEALIQWVSTDHAAAAREASFWEAAKTAAASCSSLPSYKPKAGQKYKDDLITVIPVGDPHIGMLSWRHETGVDFDCKIAQEELFTCVDDLVRQTPRAKEGRLVLLGDNFHAEDDLQRTPTSGHKLDGDGRSAKVLSLGLNLFLRLIVRMARHHEHVGVHVVPGNHDPNVALWTQLWLVQACKNMPTVTIADNRNPYQYECFGKVLLGYTHGDLAKDQDLLSIMSTDCGPGGLPGHETFWGETYYRHWLAGHIHHDTIKEYRGGIVEHVRTLAARDMWHHASGYRSGRALQALTFDREYGLRSRTVCDIRRVKALLSQ